MLEMALRQSLAMSDGQYSIFVARPISATLLGVGLILITLGLRPLVTRGLDWRARLALAEKGDEHP
jgi:TctA family transporter